MYSLDETNNAIPGEAEILETTCYPGGANLKINDEIVYHQSKPIKVIIGFRAGTKKLISVSIDGKDITDKVESLDVGQVYSAPGMQTTLGNVDTVTHINIITKPSCTSEVLLEIHQWFQPIGTGWNHIQVTRAFLSKS